VLLGLKLTSKNDEEKTSRKGGGTETKKKRTTIRVGKKPDKFPIGVKGGGKSSSWERKRRNESAPMLKTTTRALICKKAETSPFWVDQASVSWLRKNFEK